MKKILISFLLFVGIFIFWNFQAYSDCTDPLADWQNISTALNNCFEWDPDTKVVTAADGWNRSWWDSLDIAKGFKDKINSWVQTLGSILAILAVGSIVYWAFLLVISQWEEEKLKKGKDVVKWWILWFLGVVFAWALISIVVNIMFSI